MMAGRWVRWTIVLIGLVSGTAPAPSPAAEPGFSLVAKAVPDEFYHGLGGTYYPLGEQPPDLVGQPKVNQAYVWSMVHSGDDVWFGTAANPVAAALGGIAGLPIPLETEFNVFEFWKSQFPGVPRSLKLFLGDWRPPKMFRLRADGSTVNVTPDDPLIGSTTGIRCAGTADGVVLLGGPDLSQIGINLFAFDADTGAYLGSKHLPQYANIRRWLNVDGALYTGTLKTFTTTGGGAVLRWRGSKASPFEFEVVADLDNEAATLCLHDGRLFALTWSTLSQTVETLTGARAQQPAGVWVSPPLTERGLTTADRRKWTKVWNIRAYEPDEVIWRSLWMGAAASFDGHLVWGTVQVPGYGAQVLKEVYGWPGDPREVLPAIEQSFRPACLFRGRFDDQGRFVVELLYGDEELPVYVPARRGSGGRWITRPNGMGRPSLGGAGFDDPYNMYVWSMLPHQGRLWLGTFDTSFVLFGNQYVRGEDYPAGLGADLLVMDRSDQPAVAVSRTGMGNVANNGIRDMVADGEHILLGTATSANLLTDPTDELVEGGWEVLRFDPSAATIVPGTRRRLNVEAVGGLAGRSLMVP